MSKKVTHLTIVDTSGDDSPARNYKLTPTRTTWDKTASGHAAMLFMSGVPYCAAGRDGEIWFQITARYEDGSEADVSTEFVAHGWKLLREYAELTGEYGELTRSTKPVDEETVVDVAIVEAPVAVAHQEACEPEPQVTARVTQCQDVLVTGGFKLQFNPSNLDLAAAYAVLQPLTAIQIHTFDRGLEDKSSSVHALEDHLHANGRVSYSSLLDVPAHGLASDRYRTYAVNGWRADGVLSDLRSAYSTVVGDISQKRLSLSWDRLYVGDVYTYNLRIRDGHRLGTTSRQEEIEFYEDLLLDLDRRLAPVVGEIKFTSAPKSSSRKTSTSLSDQLNGDYRLSIDAIRMKLTSLAVAVAAQVPFIEEPPDSSYVRSIVVIDRTEADTGLRRIDLVGDVTWESEALTFASDLEQVGVLEGEMWNQTACPYEIMGVWSNGNKRDVTQEVIAAGWKLWRERENARLAARDPAEELPPDGFSAVVSADGFTVYSVGLDRASAISNAHAAVLLWSPDKLNVHVVERRPDPEMPETPNVKITAFQSRWFEDAYCIPCSEEFYDLQDDNDGGICFLPLEVERCWDEADLKTRERSQLAIDHQAPALLAA